MKRKGLIICTVLAIICRISCHLDKNYYGKIKALGCAIFGLILQCLYDFDFEREIFSRKTFPTIFVSVIAIIGQIVVFNTHDEIPRDVIDCWIYEFPFDMMVIIMMVPNILSANALVNDNHYDGIDSASLFFRMVYSAIDVLDIAYVVFATEKCEGISWFGKVIGGIHGLIIMGILLLMVEKSTKNHNTLPI